MLLADTVLVEDGTITAVGSHLALPPEVTLVDGTGLTLLPGLIDAHTHTFGPALQQALTQPSLDPRRLRSLLTPASWKALIISRSCMTTAKAVVDPSTL